MLHYIGLNVAAEQQPGCQALHTCCGWLECVINFTYSHVISNKFKNILTRFSANPSYFS